MAKRDFVKCHLRQALRAARAELDGDEELSRRLHAEAKLRLVRMSDEELWELAKLTSSPEKPVESVYKVIKQAIEEHRATASEWMKDLVERPMPDKEGKDTGRILIIEGEPALRRELTSALTQASFTVAGVADCPEALLMKLEFKPDMVIVDEVLPGGDGLKACSQLHSTFGIPVILLGSDSSDEIWTKAVEAGADFYFRKPFSYLKKPFSYLELVARVKAILRHYKKATP